MLPLPPNSATKRPPGTSARAMDETAPSAFFTQCSAALEKTASNGSAKSKPAASPKTNASPGKFLRAVGQHVRRVIETGNLRARPGDFGCELAGAAAEIENSLARLRGQKLQKIRAEAPDERMLVLVAGGVPAPGAGEPLTPFCRALRLSWRPWRAVQARRAGPRLLGGFNRGSRRGGGENFLEQLGLLQVFLGGRRLFVAIIMIVIAGAAADFGGLCAD